MVLAGYRSYSCFDNKIKESTTGWEILFYTILPVAVNILFFAGGLVLLVYSYAVISSAG